MKIAVMGAGAVGGYFGARLAQAGHEVTLIGRQALVAAVNRDGLRLRAAFFDGLVAMHASTQPQAAADAELVLFCVKSADTESAARAMAPYLRDDAIVLSLQNGIDNAARLRAALPGRRVLAGSAYVAVASVAPGHVEHHGRGELRIEASDVSDSIAATFGAASIPAETVADIDAALWRKLVVNCACNALSAIAQVSYGELAAHPGVETLMHDVVDECRAVAAAGGVALDRAELIEALRGILGSMPRQLSSTAQDLAAGRRSEIDHLNGAVVARGEALGIATPANRALLVAVQLMEFAARGRGA